jgi:hypothetical protein
MAKLPLFESIKTTQSPPSKPKQNNNNMAASPNHSGKPCNRIGLNKVSV